MLKTSFILVFLLLVKLTSFSQCSTFTIGISNSGSATGCGTRNLAASATGNVWSQKTNFSGTSRYGAVAFSIGNKGYVGTGMDGSTFKNDFWEYDPSTNAWTQKANFGGTARYGAVAFNIGTKGYIGTGYDGNQKNDFWEYDPSSNSWTQKNNFGGSARMYAAGFSISTKGYIGTGGAGSTTFDDFWEYDVSANSWTQKAVFGGGQRHSAVGLSINSKGYIGSGYGTYSGFNNDFWEYNPTSNTWTQLNSLGTTAFYGASAFTLGNEGYIVGGYEQTSTVSNKLWKYNVTNNSWTQMTNLSSANARHKAAGFSIGLKGYLVTGYDAINSELADLWEYESVGTYSWSTGALTSVITATGSGSYSVLVTSASGCTATAIQTLVLAPNPTISVNGSTILCTGMTTSLSASGATSYTWSSNAGGGNSNSVTVTPSVSTIYTIAGTTGTCSTNYTLPLTVLPMPIASISVIGPTAGCGTSTLQVNSNASTWTQKANFGGAAREQAVGFSIGTKGYIGTGKGLSANYYKDFWEYDPATNAWTQKANFGGTARWGAVGFSLGTKGYIGTGQDVNNTTTSDFWEYDPTLNTWTQKANFGGGARYWATGFSINTKAYVGLGTGTSGIDFWEYDPGLNTWTKKADFIGGARHSAVGFGLGNKGYVGTGYMSFGSNDFWEFDPIANTWTQKANIGNTLIYRAVGFTIGNVGYIATGYESATSTRSDKLWQYDPIADYWMQAPSLGSANARYSAVAFSIGSRGYIGTGNPSSTGTSLMEYEPAGTFTWSSGSQYQFITATTSGNYSVLLTSVIGCSASASQSLTLSPNPTISISGPVSICSGGNSSLTASGATSYTWSANAGGSNSNAIVVSPSVSTIFTLTGSLGNCTVNFNQPFIVNPTPSSLIATSGPTLNCGSLTLSASSGGNTWSQRSGILTGRSSAVAFSIGNKGYVGTGYNQYSSPDCLRDFWEYDPLTDTWTQKANFSGGFRRGAVGFSIGSKGYVGTGIDLGAGATNDFWEYDPSTNVWTRKADVGTTLRFWATAFSIGSKGYIGVGKDPSNIFLSDFWEYDPSNDTWTQKTNYPGAGRYFSASFSIGTKGYIGTGFAWPGANSSDFWEYNQTTNTWTQKANYGGAVTSEAVGFSSNGKGYFACGAVSNTCWEYDPLNNTWTQKASFGTLPKRGMASAFTIGSRCYMGFGWYNVSPGTVYHNDLWEYDPGANAQWSTNSIQPSITVTNTSLYSLTLTSVAGCSNTGSQSVALSPNPTISLNGNLFSCSGVNNTLSASGAGTYTWSANAGSSNSTSVVVTSSNNETYSVAGTTGSCSVTQTLFVLNITPSLSLTGPSSGCGTVALNTSAIGDYWSQKAALTSITPRHNGIALSIGTKAYVGMGMNTSTTPNTFNDFWEYDPAMNTWTQKANFAGGVRAAAVGFSIGSKGYVGTGFDYSTNTYKNDFWEYDPIANTWTQKANFVSVRSLAVGFGLGSKGYIGTGISNVTPYYYNDFWEYDPSNNTWTQKTNFAGTARCAASAFCIGNLAYVGTGELSASTSTTDIWQYDPSANTWTQKTSYPGSPIKSCASFNIGTKGYITTGMTSSGKSNMTYEYDPLSNTWVNKASFSNGPRAYASGFSIGNKGYITLGLNDSSPYEAKDLFEYNPSLSYVWSTGSTVQTTATSLTGMQLLTVTNVLGCSVSASQSVTVLPSPTLSVSGPTIICEGNAASLNVSGANSFSWSPNSGGSNASSVILSPSITTAYSVSGNNGSCTTIYPFTVSVNPSPTISANSGSICSGGTFTLNPSGAISYSYSSGSNIVSPSVTNTYSITGTSSLGCVSLSSAMVTISVAPLPTLSVNSGSICVGKSFSLTPGGASSYTVLNITGTIVSPTINTSYSVSGTSSVGCVSANFAISTITVNSLPIVTVNSGTACSGQTFTLTPVGAISYTYSGGSANINANITNTYSVIGEDNNGCVSLPAISSLSVFPSPTISISSGSICVGQSFTLLPSGANTFSIEGNNAVVSPTISTTYTVSGTSSVGCISQNYATASVTVNSIPVISVNSGSICFGQSFTIIPNGASTYSFSGGSSIVSPTNTISYSVNGTSTEGCISNTFAIANITVHPLPLISVNSGSICAGESFTIVPNGAISYSYSSGSSVVSPTITSSYFVNGTSIEGCITNTPVVLNVSVFALPSIIVSNYSICSGNSVAILPSGASTYSISGANFTVSPTSTTIYSVNGSSSAGCVSSIATLTVEVMPNPTITVSNATSCAGSSVIIVPSGANSYSINGGSFTVNPIISTAYSVTGTSSSGCQASNPAISYITVNALPNITVNSGSICSGDSFTFVPTGAVSYTFEGGNAIVNPSQSTSYSISGTDLNGCIGSSNGNITVLALPQITISSSDSLICEGESVTLTANGAMSYTWSTNDTLSSLILVPTISTNYSVVAIGVNGCRNQNNYLQLVSSCTGIKTTTIKQIASISIYPNPTAGRFFIELNLKGRIQIIDILGRIVYDNIHDSGSHSFDLQSLNNGLYIVNFINEQHSLSEKLILTK